MPVSRAKIGVQGALDLYQQDFHTEVLVLDEEMRQRCYGARQLPAWSVPVARSLARRPRGAAS